MIPTRRFLFSLILAHSCIVVPHAFGEEALTDVSKIRSLSREETAQALPVKLSGVVIYSADTSLVIHDGKASIYLDFGFAKTQGVWKDHLPNLKHIQPGTVLEVEGVTDPGGFSPMVLVANFRRNGTQPIPTPIRPSLEVLLSSSLNSQWVEVEGVVRKFQDSPEEPQYLNLLVGGHSCPVLPYNRLNLSRAQLVDAKIRVRGVVLDIANLRSQASGLKIHSNGAVDIDVIAPPPKNPFLAPKVSLSQLIAFSPDADIGHRRVSSGVVTFAMPGRFFYVRDQESCVRVDSAEAQVAPGDLVEFTGFIETSGVLASFSEAMVRKIGTGSVPPPEEILISEILNPKTRSPYEMVTEPGNPDRNGQLIRLSGTLRGILPPDGDGYTTLVIESGTHLLQALVPVRETDWVVGSVVELTGVCELEMARLDKMPWFSITGFHVWLSSPSGLRVISEPPWWTPQRLGILLAAVVLVLGVALAWGYIMRHKVRVRSTQLATEIAARESSKLEFDTILRERRRLANDLHDTLEQNLTGLALQLEIASRSRSTDPGLSERHLHLAQQFLERSRTEAHRAVWDLRADGQDGRDFLEILDGRVSSMVAGTDIAITLKREGDSLPLPDLVAGNLMLLAQEAVTNALKHSGAAKIEILFRQSSGKTELVISDNGRGFDVSAAPGQKEGHFGLQGMRERTKRLGGEIEIESSPIKGTTLRVRVPSPSAATCDEPSIKI